MHLCSHLVSTTVKTQSSVTTRLSMRMVDRPLVSLSRMSFFLTAQMESGLILFWPSGSFLCFPSLSQFHRTCTVNIFLSFWLAVYLETLGSLMETFGWDRHLTFYAKAEILLFEDGWVPIAIGYLILFSRQWRRWLLTGERNGAQHQDGYPSLRAKA